MLIHLSIGSAGISTEFSTRWQHLCGGRIRQCQNYPCRTATRDTTVEIGDRIRQCQNYPCRKATGDTPVEIGDRTRQCQNYPCRTATRNTPVEIGDRTRQCQNYPCRTATRNTPVEIGDSTRQCQNYPCRKATGDTPVEMGDSTRQCQNYPCRTATRDTTVEIGDRIRQCQNYPCRKATGDTPVEIGLSITPSSITLQCRENPIKLPSHCRSVQSRLRSSRYYEDLRRTKLTPTPPFSPPTIRQQLKRMKENRECHGYSSSVDFVACWDTAVTSGALFDMQYSISRNTNIYFMDLGGPGKPNQSIMLPAALVAVSQVRTRTHWIQAVKTVNCVGPLNFIYQRGRACSTFDIIWVYATLLNDAKKNIKQLSNIYMILPGINMRAVSGGCSILYPPVLPIQSCCRAVNGSEVELSLYLWMKSPKKRRQGVDSIDSKVHQWKVQACRSNQTKSLSPAITLITWILDNQGKSRPEDIDPLFITLYCDLNQWH
ncbi:hypothetical protein RRG08_046923 [Elysia crispata]|uniref:Uncharacterized protein n=1 Tax=Elysia crispata TaxID=231223 RepID=A0AAE1A8T8_9GAST|nr:hypothetical protein RRG08_046923 [Elysia crispata]